MITGRDGRLSFLHAGAASSERADPWHRRRRRRGHRRRAPGRAGGRALLTAHGLTAFYLSRIERLDPLLHSVITVSGEALAEAQACDEARPAGRPRARWRASRS